MIAQETFDQFEPLIDQLSRFAHDELQSKRDRDAARDVLPNTDTMLDPAAIPTDPDQAAIIGVIDYAIPFAHQMLRTASGHSRVAAIWLQDGPMQAQGPADIAFGCQLHGTAIDQLRQTHASEGQVYRTTGSIDFQHAAATPGRGPGLGHAVTHGSAVAGLAAGFDPEDPLAQHMPVIAVSLPGNSVASSAGALAPFYIQAGVVYIVNRARKLARELRRAGRTGPVPLIINLSFGVTAGPRDGSSLIAQLQDLISMNVSDLVDPVHFVLPMGNSRQDRLHGVIEKGQSVGWSLPPDDPTPNVIEIRGPRQDSLHSQPLLQFRITMPDGAQADTAFAGPNAAALLMRNGRECGRAYLQTPFIQRLQSGESYFSQCLTLILAQTRARGDAIRAAPSGLWSVEVIDGPATPLSIDVQRDEEIAHFNTGARQSHLRDLHYARFDASGRELQDDPQPTTTVVRRRGTTNVYATGDEQLRVGSSVGRTGKITPALPEIATARYSSLLEHGATGDVLAEGDRSHLLPGILVAGSETGQTAFMAGTSMSAARVTRWLALKQRSGAGLRGRQDVIDAVMAEYFPV